MNSQILNAQLLNAQSSAIILGHTETMYHSEPLRVQLDQGRFAAASSMGRRYKSINEDRVLILPTDSTLLVVDGMGGPGGGAVAADIMIECFQSVPPSECVDPLEVLQKVSGRIRKECGTASSGVCYVWCWLNGRQLHAHYAGDVKLVVFDPSGGVKFASTDHSLVNDMIKTGIVSERDAAYHPQRHIVTKAVTGNSFTEFDILPTIQLETGDRLMVATDGLTDNLRLNEIADLTMGQEVGAAVKALMDFCLDKMNGSHISKWQGSLKPKPDNISILLGEIG